MQAKKEKRKVDLKVKMKEQEVLKYELSSLKPGAKVYRKQQNSNLMFMSGIEQEMKQAKQNLDSLQQEYEELEASPADTEGTGEEEEEEEEEASSSHTDCPSKKNCPCKR